MMHDLSVPGCLGPLVPTPPAPPQPPMTLREIEQEAMQRCVKIAADLYGVNIELLAKPSLEVSVARARAKAAHLMSLERRKDDTLFSAAGIAALLKFAAPLVMKRAVERAGFRWGKA